MPSDKNLEQNPNIIRWSLTIVGLGGAGAHLLWPEQNLDSITIGFLVVAALPWLSVFMKRAELPGGIKFEFVDPKPATGIKGDSLPLLDPKEKLPPDFLFLNHTSFYLDKKDKHRKEQEEIRQKTKVDRKHYHIHVIVDSYYEGALDQIDHVEYILHKAYPEPRRIKSNREQNFLLKEMANGEYVLSAKVFIYGRDHPIHLFRYMTLWDTGPILLEGQG